MASLELILNSVAIPAAFLASLVILFRNPENITNILVSVTLLIGGVLGVSFDLAKELVYSLNLHLALIFEKMAFVMIFWLILPLGVFSIFFWRSLYHSLPHFLHIFSPVIPLAMTLWLFLDETTIQLIPTDFGILTIQKKSFSIVSFVLLLIVFLFFLSELGYMAYKSRSFPKLQRKMISFIIGIGIGFIGSLFSVFIFPLLFPLALPPTPIFIIIGSMSLIIICLKAIARESQKFWHGCPKLSREIDGTKICLNVDDLEEPKEVNLLDISAVVERIQIDTDVLQSDSNDCLNMVFAGNNGYVYCLTTHKPIKVLGENVTVEEMELAQSMDALNNIEDCPDCLHKIIAYRKKHKDKTPEDIKRFFMGLRAEDIFGLAT